MSETHTVAIVMSRMPRLVSPDAIWLSGLRACLRRIRERHQTLRVTLGTSGADFVVRGAQRLGIDLQFLPDIVADEDPSARDRQIVHLADELFVLGVRKQGNVHRLLLDRLQTGRNGVSLVDLPGLQHPVVRDELLAAAATLWAPSAAGCRPLLESSETGDQASHLSELEIVSFTSPPQNSANLFLTHTTRACPAPWPRQSSDEYLDSLLDARPEGDHSALMTLRRIVQQRLLIGSGRTIRGGFPVVSFTAVSLNQLPELRCFRTHRSHWDFEPYGLCIRRGALERHGVRPVTYGTETTWQTLSDTDRPYFQSNGEVASSSSATRSSDVDWSVEREWRIPGDLDLSAFTCDELFFFVPRFEDAKILQLHCPWPVTLWPGEILAR